jgi:flagellar protein FliL
MPPTAKEPAPAQDQAPAAAATATAPTPPSGGGFKAWLPLVATVLVMPVLAYAMTTFVLVPRIQKGLGVPEPSTAAEGGEHKKSSSAAKKETAPINKLLVNVAGTMGARYLLVSLSVAGTDPEFKTKLQELDPQLRDMACGALRTKTLADLEKPGACNLIRSELLSGFNNILGGPVVQDIYFTEFAIQ